MPPKAPDWVCEVLSPSTDATDGDEKMPVYAREGVAHAWLVDPLARTVEVYSRDAGRRWGTPRLGRGDACVRLPPFDAFEFDLAVLWA